MNEIEELEKNLEDFKNNLYTTNGLKDLLEKEINLIQEYDNKNTELLNSMENIMDKNKECIDNATTLLSENNKKNQDSIIKELTNNLKQNQDSIIKELKKVIKMHNTNTDNLITQIQSLSEHLEDLLKNNITNLNNKIDNNNHEVLKKLKGIKIMNIFILLFCIIIIILHFYF